MDDDAILDRKAVMQMMHGAYLEALALDLKHNNRFQPGCTLYLESNIQEDGKVLINGVVTHPDREHYYLRNLIVCAPIPV